MYIGPDPWREMGDDVDRRRLLGMTAKGLIAAGTIGREQLWDNLLHVRHGVVDVGWVRAAEETTRVLVSGYSKVRPAELLPMVAGHLNVIRGRVGEPMSERVRREVGGITAETAGLAAETAMQTGDFGAADAYLALAQEAALESDDVVLGARVEALTGVRHSKVPRGGLEVDRDALWHLERSAGVLRHGGPPTTTAWAEGKLAVEYAAAGWPTKAARAMGRVEKALAGRNGSEKGLWSEHGLLAYLASDWAAQGYEALVLMLMEHSSAAEEIEKVLDRGGEGTWQGGLHADLVSVYAQAGELDRAVWHGRRALALVEENGFELRRERLKGRMAGLARWQREPDVVALQEGLA